MILCTHRFPVPPAGHKFVLNDCPDGLLENIIRRASEKTSLAAAWVALRAIRDSGSSDGFPPLKSVAAAMMIVWDTSEVSTLDSPPAQRKTLIWVTLKRALDCMRLGIHQSMSVTVYAHPTPYL